MLTSICLLSVIFLTVAILTGMRWHLTVILICISLMSCDAQHFSFVYWPFVYLFFEKWPFKSITHILITFWPNGQMNQWSIDTYSGYQYFTNCVVWKYFLQYFRFSLHSFDWFPLLCGSFLIYIIPFIFAFVSYALIGDLPPKHSYIF